MNSATTTPAKLTFFYTFCDDAIGSDFRHTETVHASGLIESHFVGRDNGEYINRKSTRNAGQALDLRVVREHRERAGWKVLA